MTDHTGGIILDRIKPVKTRNFTERKFQGSLVDAISGGNGHGWDFHEYLKYLVNKLNATDDSKKDSAIGFLIDDTNQDYLMTEADVKEARAKLARFRSMPVLTDKQQTEKRNVRKELADHHTNMITLNAAAGKVIQLMKDTSTSDLHNLITTASIGNEKTPFKGMTQILHLSKLRYTGTPAEIHRSLLRQLATMGYATTPNEVTELLNQTTSLNTAGFNLLMQPNPAVNEEILEAAEEQHAAQIAKINAINAVVGPALQMPVPDPFQRPAEFIPKSADNTLPTTKEIAKVIISILIFTFACSTI